MFSPPNCAALSRYAQNYGKMNYGNELIIDILMGFRGYI